MEDGLSMEVAVALVGEALMDNAVITVRLILSLSPISIFEPNFESKIIETLFHAFTHFRKKTYFQSMDWAMSLITQMLQHG